MFGILVWGDSISFGRGESSQLGWSGRLKNYFESRDFYNCLFNLSIPGDTSTSLLNRFETEIKARVKFIRPDDKFIIIIGVGVNDSRRLASMNGFETELNLFEQNISTLINIAKKYTKEIVILELIPVDENKTAHFENTSFTNDVVKIYNKVLKDSANKNKIHYIELFDLFFKLNYIDLLFDGLHPNKEGYQKMYGFIKDYLIKKELII